MAWFDCFWYEFNIQHLAEHGVTPEEFEEVITATRNATIEESRTGSVMVRGKTSNGRWLVCIFRRIDDVSILPITAYEPEE